MKNVPIPPPLTEISDPPKELYIRGELPSLDDHIYLTVVGSRKYTNYGREACEILIAGLAGYPIVIVSGLALGMDTIAHRAALAAGLKTVAFPGSGLDDSILYPASNRQLAQEILDAGGALVSEYKPDQIGAQWTFPQRNRLMAGIARATLVIEATNKSGTRITAKLATEYNRDVFAVPGSIFSTSSEGANQLIRDGATPITSPKELLMALGFDVTDTPPENLFDQCSDDEKKVLLLLASPQPRGELLRTLGLGTSMGTALLSAMEIKGLIKESMGEMRRC